MTSALFRSLISQIGYTFHLTQILVHKKSKVDSMERMIESENIKIKDFELKAAEAEKEYKTCEHIQDLDNKVCRVPQ